MLDFAPLLEMSRSSTSYRSIGDIPAFPFRTFAELQKAAKDDSFSVGVDPLAAAEWSDSHSTGLKRVLVSSLSILLIALALASIVAGVWLKDYWLLAATPVMAGAFYFSNPASAYHKWVTVIGAAGIAVFIDLLVNGLVTAAILVAYADLTFAAVRAAGWVTDSGFRKHLLANESDFLSGYFARKCNVRDNKTKKVYSAR
jgi:hypothetical protein